MIEDVWGILYVVDKDEKIYMNSRWGGHGLFKYCHVPEVVCDLLNGFWIG
jgi:hypothetical protein